MTTENIFIEETPDTIAQKLDVILDVFEQSVRSVIVLREPFVFDPHHKIYDWDKQAGNKMKIWRMCKELQTWTVHYMKRSDGDVCCSKLPEKLKYCRLSFIASEAALSVHIVNPAANEEIDDPFNVSGISDAISIGRVFHLYKPWISLMNRPWQSVTIEDIIVLEKSLNKLGSYFRMADAGNAERIFNGALQLYFKNTIDQANLAKVKRFIQEIDEKCM